MPRRPEPEPQEESSSSYESGSEEDESESESDGSVSQEEEEVLAAFSTTSSRKSTSLPPQKMPTNKKIAAGKSTAGKTVAKAKKVQGGKGKAGAQANQAHKAIPLVGPVLGVEDVILCDVSASLESHMEDTEKLLAAFQAAVKGHEPLISKAVEMTEEKCAQQKAVAVEAATLAAVQATEMRMEGVLRDAVAEAVAEARFAAQEAQQVAVSAAVQLAEERAAEQQRVAVQAVTLEHQRNMGKGDDELAAEKAASNFQLAAASAGHALAAASRLLARENGGIEEDGTDDEPADVTNTDVATAPSILKPDEGSAVSAASTMDF